MLVQCFKEAVVTLSTIPAPNPQEVGGERGEASEAVVGFNNRVSELSKSLTQMSHHMGMLVLQQKKAHLVSVGHL